MISNLFLPYLKYPLPEPSVPWISKDVVNKPNFVPVAPISAKSKSNSPRQRVHVGNLLACSSSGAIFAAIGKQASFASSISADPSVFPIPSRAAEVLSSYNSDFVLRCEDGSIFCVSSTGLAPLVKVSSSCRIATSSTEPWLGVSTSNRLFVLELPSGSEFASFAVPRGPICFSNQSLFVSSKGIIHQFDLLSSTCVASFSVSPASITFAPSNLSYNCLCANPKKPNEIMAVSDSFIHVFDNQQLCREMYHTHGSAPLVQFAGNHIVVSDRSHANIGCPSAWERIVFETKVVGIDWLNRNTLIAITEGGSLISSETGSKKFSKAVMKKVTNFSIVQREPLERNVVEDIPPLIQLYLLVEAGLGSIRKCHVHSPSPLPGSYQWKKCVEKCILSKKKKFSLDFFQAQLVPSHRVRITSLLNVQIRLAKVFGVYIKEADLEIFFKKISEIKFFENKNLSSSIAFFDVSIDKRPGPVSSPPDEEIVPNLFGRKSSAITLDIIESLKSKYRIYFLYTFLSSLSLVFMKKESKSGMSAKAGPAGMNSFFLSYPVFCAASDGKGLLITGGGGGGKAYGVINYLQAHVVISEPTLTVETIATLDTGADAPTALDYCPSASTWACAMGNRCMLFKFNDESLTMEPLFNFKSEISGPDRDMTNFVKIFKTILITGGENKIVRLWDIDKSATLRFEIKDHQAEVVDADASPFNTETYLSCGKEGKVLIWGKSSVISTICPKGPKFPNLSLSIRSAFFINSTQVVVLAHHPRGPAYLFLYTWADPLLPVSIVEVSAKQITPSMAINQERTKIAVSHAGGEKDIYQLPSLKRLNRMNKHCHEMPPGKTVFVNDLIVSGSPDFSLNFFDPKKTSNLIYFIFIIFFMIVYFIIYHLKDSMGYQEL